MGIKIKKIHRTISFDEEIIRSMGKQWKIKEIE